MINPTKLFVIIALTLVSTSIFSQESKKTDSIAIQPKKQKDWEFKISPYALLAAQATDVDGEKIRQSFNDLASLTNFGFQIAAQAKYKKWFLNSNLTIAKLGANETIGPAQVDLNIHQIILDTKLGYVIIDNFKDTNNVIEGWSVETTIGAIYWLNDVNIDLDIQIGDLPPIKDTIKEKQEWVDLVLGANFRLVLSKTVGLGISANIGGFGIGNSSELYWDLTYINTFKVSKHIDVAAGYRTFKYNRTDGTGVDEINTSVTVFGPLLGISANF